MNWNKYQKALEQFSRKTNTQHHLDAVMQRSEALFQICGPSTHNNRAMLKIGYTLLQSNEMKILAPCCPDYSHHRGMYTFDKLNGGISLLAINQIEFLRALVKLGVKVFAKLVYADQEVDDWRMLDKVRTSESEFMHRINQSLAATKKLLKDDGWDVDLMTQLISSFRDKERELTLMIEANQSWRHRLQTETLQRTEMYLRIQNPLPAADALKRTIRTAAQYMVLGNYAKETGYLISNHTTTNLGWYAETNAGVLHNPVEIY